MIIFEFLAYLFIEIIFQGIISGMIKLFKKLYNFIFPKKKEEFIPYRKRKNL